MNPIASPPRSRSRADDDAVSADQSVLRRGDSPAHAAGTVKDVAVLCRSRRDSCRRRDRFELLREHTVVEGDRPDNLAAAYLGDPEQFWRLADANYDLNPFDLTATVNRRLRITLPEGIPAMPPIT